MWIARDGNDRLFLYFGIKPVKCGFYWLNGGKYTEIVDDFPSVKWEDDEATEVEYNDQNELVICG